MKVNRRSFFGVAAAAPVAAKQAVTSVIEYEKAAGSLGGAMPAYTLTNYGGSVNAMEDASWLKRELQGLMSRKKEIGTADYASYQRDLAAFIQIDNRRATSPAVRALLIAEERARRDKARELSYLDQQIKAVKEKLGPLAMIFEGGE
jgi:hypothetical protein